MFSIEMPYNGDVQNPARWPFAVHIQISTGPQALVPKSISNYFLVFKFEIHSNFYKNNY